MKLRFIPLLLLFFCISLSCRQSSMATATLSVNGRALVVEIARTRAQRTLGLMHREHLDWNAGMLFVFRKDQILSFWMKDTSIPLSIAFLDKNGKVTDSKIKSTLGKSCIVRTSIPVEVQYKGRPVKTTSPEQMVVRFETKPSRTYNILPKQTGN